MTLLFVPCRSSVSSNIRLLAELTTNAGRMFHYNIHVDKGIATFFPAHYFLTHLLFLSGYSYYFQSRRSSRTTFSIKRPFHWTFIDQTSSFCARIGAFQLIIILTSLNPVNSYQVPTLPTSAIEHQGIRTNSLPLGFPSYYLRCE